VIRFEDIDSAVLVGHSMGGVIIPRVAEALPDRVRLVAWLAAVVTADGESLLDAVPQSPWIARAVTIGEDGTAHTDPERIVDANIHDGSPEDRAFVRDRHLAYPPYALVEPGRLRAFLALGIPTGYVVPTQDRTLEPHIARGFADRLPGCRRAEVDAGHDCMITQPEATASALVAVSSG
jgi:pimeloyl-ACP methyl ester carboxylesterase